MESFFNNSITGESTLSGNYDMNRQNIGLRKENKRLRRAWMKAQQTGNIYSHVAYALARGCVDLFYVNVDSGEFIEYDTDDDRGMLKEVRRASEFFKSCEREGRLFVHPEDQD